MAPGALNGVVTIWDVEARMVAAIDWTDKRAAANEARDLLRALHSTSFVLPGAAMDAILDAYSEIMAAAE